MSGAHIALAGASSGIVVPVPVGGIGDLEFGVAASASLQFNTNGTTSSTGNTTNADNWYVRSIVGIGDFYWVRMTVTTGSSPDIGTVGSWLQLSSARSWSWAQTVTGANTATVTIEFALDAAGADVVSSKGGINVNVEVA